MATIGELKIHVTTCGIPELEHLLSMLQANIDNLPTIVVKAMEALAESAESNDDSKWPELVSKLDPASQCALARAF